MPIRTAAHIARIEALPVEALAKEIGMRRIGETKHAVGDIVTSHPMPARTERKVAAETVRHVIVLSEQVVRRQRDLVRPLAIDSAAGQLALARAQTG
jgi:hypothetical protein